MLFTYNSAAGGRALARSLRSNSHLRTLDLRWNDLGNEGARALKDALTANSTLETMLLSGNKVDQCLLENIEALLAQRDTRAGNSCKCCCCNWFSHARSLHVLLTTVHCGIASAQALL
jgi:Leucine Rich repeat